MHILEGSPHWELHCLRAKCSHKLFGILLYERFIYSSYLFIESFIYSSIDSWIFTLYLGYKPELFYFSFFILYFSAQFVPALDSGWSFNWFQCVALKQLHQSRHFWGILPYFLTTRCSWVPLHISCLSLGISSLPWVLSLEVGAGNHDWLLGVLIATGASGLPSLSAGSKGIYVWY